MAWTLDVFHKNDPQRILSMHTLRRAFAAKLNAERTSMITGPAWRSREVETSGNPRSILMSWSSEDVLSSSVPSQGALAVRNLPANKAGSIRDAGLIPGLGRSPGGGNGRPLQYPCLENPMDRGDWRATVHRISKSQTQLKRLSMHACLPEYASSFWNTFLLAPW